MSRRLAVVFVLTTAVHAAGQQTPLHATFYSDQLPSGVVRVALDARPPVPDGARLMEDGQPGNPPASSTAFRDTGLGIAAVLAVDASGSMKGMPFEAVKAALHEFVSASRAQDRIALISFADTVEVRQPFTSDKEQLSRAIDALAPGGRTTVLNKAIDGGLTLLSGESTGRRHLLMITDGKNEGAGPAISSLSKRARELGIPVNTIGVTRLAPSWLAPMISLAQATGGAYIRVRNYDEMKGAMSEGIDWLMQSPVVTFKLAKIKPDGARHQFRIEMPGRTTETVEMIVPKPSTSVSFLYISVAAAALLLIAGMVLILFGRRSGPAARAPQISDVAPMPAWTPRAERTRTILVAGAGPATGQAAESSPGPADSSVRPRAPQQPPMKAPSPPVRQTDPLPQQSTEFRNAFPQPSVAQPVAWLRILEGPSSGARYPVNSTDIRIGAADDNQIVLGQDATVSAHHASVSWDRGDLYLLDNRSTNGTSVNSRKIEPGTRVRLRPGDRISIGRCRLSFDA